MTMASVSTLKQKRTHEKYDPREPVPWVGPKARITGGTRAKLVSMIKDRYETAEVSVRCIARETGRSYGFVLRALRESGAVIREQGNHPLQSESHSTRVKSVTTEASRAPRDVLFGRALGRMLRERRVALGMTRAQLLEQLDIDFTEKSLAFYENGTRMPSLPRLINICMALRLDFAEFAVSLAQRYTDRFYMTLRIDVHALATADDHGFAAVRAWATNILREDPSVRTKALDPATVREFAILMRCEYEPLVDYLLTFTVPDFLSREIDTN